MKNTLFIFLLVVSILSTNIVFAQNSNYTIKYSTQLVSEDDSLTIKNFITKSSLSSAPYYTLYYSKGDGKLEKIDFVKGNNVVYQFQFTYKDTKIDEWKVLNPDGTVVYSYKYNYENGKLSKLEKYLQGEAGGEEGEEGEEGETPAAGNLEYFYTYEYDTNGDLYKKTFYKANALVYYDVYFYNEKGQLMNVDRMYPEGKVAKVEISQEKKMQKSSSTNKAPKYVIKYFTKWRALKDQSIEFYDELPSSNTSTTSLYFKVMYNNLGKYIRTTEYKNQVATVIDYYDDTQKIIKKEILSTEGNVSSTMVYKRDEEGNIITEQYDAEGNVIKEEGAEEEE